MNSATYQLSHSASLRSTKFFCWHHACLAALSFNALNSATTPPALLASDAPTGPAGSITAWQKKHIAFFSDCDDIVLPTPNHLQVILSSRSKPFIFPLLSMVSHIHLKHSIHHQLSFVFAFQWPSFYHTDPSAASQPHLKPTCIRPASTGVSTVFPSPGASYILTSKPSQNSSPCLRTCRSTNTKRNCCGIRPTRLHLQNHSKAKNHSRTCSKQLQNPGLRKRNLFAQRIGQFTQRVPALDSSH